MLIKWIGGASVLLQFDNIKILCDPVFCKKGTVQNYHYFKSIRLTEPEYKQDDLKNIDLLLLTHSHLDHFDEVAKLNIHSNTTITNMIVKDFKIKNQIILNKNQKYVNIINSIKISIIAISATHGRNYILGKMVGNNNGYLISFEKENQITNIYFTGDDVFHKMKKELVGVKIDLLIANAGCATVGNGLLGKIIGRITNNIKDLMLLNEAYNPKYFLPVHFGTFSHYQEKEYDKNIIGNNTIIINPGESINLA